jgi:hypothetical protein
MRGEFTYPFIMKTFLERSFHSAGVGKSLLKFTHFLLPHCSFVVIIQLRVEIILFIEFIEMGSL